MKKGDRRRQRKAHSRKNERPRRAPRPASPRRVLREARSYPLEGCWTLPDWQQLGLAPVVVARRQPNGNIAFGVFLVDFYLLGVKDTWFNINVPPHQFYREILPDILNDEPFEISAALAHEMIYGSIDYASQFGFPAHSDFRQTRYLLDLAETHPRSGKVVFGYEGKPFYVQGPDDNPEAILRRLERTVGEDNYLFMVGGPLPEDWDESDEWEEVPDEWDDESPPPVGEG
jgi:hypothetical protein